MANAKMAVEKPLKWQVLSWLLRTVGRTSNGISLGFARGFDSGEMLDYIYEDHARGRLLVGILLDRIYLNAVGWRAIRARKELLKTVLEELLLERARDGCTTTILDIASGPGRYLQETCLALRLEGTLDRVTVLCRDLNPTGLQKGRRQAAALGLANFRYEEGDACDPEALSTATPQPEVVIASGLYELLPSSLIRRSMEGVYRTLAPGGRFIFTTQVNHPQLELIANTLVNRDGEPWVMECRPLEETEQWAREAGFTVMISHNEPLGLFGVTVCSKGGKVRARNEGNDR